MPLRFAVRSLAVSLLAAVPVALAAAPAGAVLPADSTVILSGAPSLLAPLPAPVADSLATRQAVSQDGRFVAFASNSDGLSSEDDDGVSNVYVRDRLTGTTTLVSRASGANGEPAHGGCDNPAISDDGTRVAFFCSGPLDPVDVDNTPDVYLRDLTTDQTILVSRQSGAAGALGADGSSAPALDEHGAHVAFASRAQFVPGVQGEQVYLRDVPLDPQQAGSGALTLVSRGDGATANLPNAFSSDPSISDDGTKVAFLSHASNLATGATNGTNDVFVRDLAASPPTTTLISRQSAADGGVEADGEANDAMISGDGATVAFASTATILDPATLSGLRLHVYKRSGQTTTLVDRQLNGTGAGNGDALAVAIDDGGKAIAFASSATNLVDAALDGDPAFDTYVYDARGASPIVRLASRASGASSPAANRPDGEPPSVSGDGTQVLFATDGSVTGDALPGVQTLALRDLSSDTTSAVVLPTGATGFGNQGGDTGDASISADGRFVAFETNAPALGVPSTARSEIVVRDTVTGAAPLASREDGVAGAPMTGTDIQNPSLSADGRRVAFEADDARGVRSIWVRDLATGTTILASGGIGGAPADRDAFGPSISADGTHVAFVSSATDLVAGVTQGKPLAYVRDLGPGGETVLASDDGTGGNLNVDAVALNRDGTRIAFATTGSLVGQDTDGLDDVYVRDLTPGGQTVLASVGPDGANSDQTAKDPAISADGTHVAFDTSSGNLGTAPPVGATEVWVRDLRPGGTTTLASRADGANGALATGRSLTPALSADGHVAVFVSDAGNLFPGAGRPNDAVYRRDLAAGTTRLVSRGPGPDGAPVPALPSGNRPVAVTADGGCVTFSGPGDGLGPVPGALDFSQVYLRTFEPDCGRPVPVGPGRDRTPPVLRSVSLTHKRFRVGKARTAVSAAVAAAAKRKPPIPRGTLLRFRSSEAGRLSIRIERARPGQKVRKGRTVTCKAVRRRPKRGACTAYARVATLTRTIKAGRGQVALSGRIARRALAPGSYRLTLTERDKAGNLSKAVRLSFTILRG